MSTLALKTLLNRLTTESEGGTFHNKELKKIYAYKAPHTLVIVRDEFLEEFVHAVSKAHKLTEDEEDEVFGIAIEEWPGIVQSFSKQIDSRDKNLEILEVSHNRIAIMFFNRQNYGRIDDAFFKNDARYSHFFKPLFKAVNTYLSESGRKGLLSKGKLGTKYKRLEETGIADYFNQGHYEGSSIHYTIASRFLPISGEKDVADDPINYFENPDILKVIKSSNIGPSKTNSEINFLLEAAGKLTGGAKPGNSDFTKTITVRFESKTKNQLTGSTVESDIRDAFVRHIRNVINGRTPIEWANQEASDSAMAIIEKTLINTAVDAGAKGVKQGIKGNSSKAKKDLKIPIKGTSSRVGFKAIGTAKRRENNNFATPSYIALVELINAQLPPQVRANMRSPRLVNRTGRFSESTRVTRIIPTTQGLPSIEYTYQRNPYDVFDKTLGRQPWNTPERDPSELVAMSVRQIAQRLGMRRFYTRRAA